MNIKTLLLVPGAIALSLSFLPVTPVVAQVETAPAVQKQRGMNKLNLTDAQKAQMKQMREQTQAQIEQILTAEQKAQLQSLKQSGGKMRGGWQSLNLSEAQKQQIRQIRENAQQSMQSILTAEQRALLEQQRQGMKERRQQFRQQRQAQPVQPQ
ncbi:MAG: P pilus assembly/Cpx signaling pathway, periplasmic inhibitor/zinc-resistance associated protein [Oscillatoriales cyanobacterium C42_A2020_001]|nr:P pilus assembly/Cpx signaling pathway, periplasmic inhibitor/zinc-resistance associated protein [Leptolyngbyaceae cyanobacterium C42_A2020_001]